MVAPSESRGIDLRSIKVAPERVFSTDDRSGLYKISKIFHTRIGFKPAIGPPGQLRIDEPEGRSHLRLVDGYARRDEVVVR